MEWIISGIVTLIAIGVIIGVSFLAAWQFTDPGIWYRKYLERAWRDTKNDQD